MTINNLFSTLISKKLAIFLTLNIFIASVSFGQKVLRVGVAGLTHDHVHNIMHQFKTGEVIIAGIVETDPQLIARYKKSNQLPDSLFYPDLNTLIAKQHPDAVLAYNSIVEHLGVVEI